MFSRARYNEVADQIWPTGLEFDTCLTSKTVLHLGQCVSVNKNLTIIIISVIRCPFSPCSDKGYFSLCIHETCKESNL